MVAVNPWKDPKKELYTRLDNARKARRENEFMWDQTDLILYGDSFTAGQSGVYTGTDGKTVVGSFPQEEADNTFSNISITYAFKNLRFIHAQLSANAPAVSASPTSGDVEDVRRADAADRLVRYSLRQYLMQEYFDLCGNDALHYGSGFLKTLWNPELGEIVSCDPITGKVVTTGDFEIALISPKRMFIDPDAEIWNKVRYVFEEKIMPYEQALYLVGPEKEEILQKFREKEYDDVSNTKKFDVVILYEYWETGMPLNGYGGRYCLCGKDGTPLTPILPNPYSFARPKGGEHAPKKAKLPFHIFTDIDVPGKVWGKSFLDYVVRPQDVLNRLDGAVLDNLEVHAVLRLILPEGAEVADESISNSPKDIIKITGNQPPFYMQPPTLAPDMSRYREMVKQGIDDMSGVNESMFGQQSRETAGFAMQYAVNQGSMIRRRLFNKFTMLAESVYKDYLDIVRTNWSIPRLVTVMGKENALESTDIKGADIDGGYDVTLSYGTNLSLDPLTRRQEILQYQPLFKEAGVSPRQSLKMMKLNDLSDYYDIIELAENRQREYFERIVGRKEYFPPRLFEDHENMLAYCKYYVMTQEFTALPDEMKDLIYKHMVERSKMPGIEKQLLSAPMGPDAAGGPAGSPEGGAPAPGMTPMPGGPGPAGPSIPPAPGAGPTPPAASGGAMPPVGLK